MMVFEGEKQMTEAATRQRRTTGAPAWASLMAQDLDASKEFYRELFGWEYRAGPQQLGPYVRAVVSGHEVAGLGRRASGRQLPIAWLPYMASDDADDTAAWIRESGGTVAVGPMDAEQAGRVVVAADPQGAVFGVWQDVQEPPLGTAPLGTHGAPVWFELITRETAAVEAFYCAVFGYESKNSGTPDFDHRTLCKGGVPVAGMHGLGDAFPAGRGPHWRTYFAVEDPDAVAARAAKLGGVVARPAQDSPYGRVAAIADPEGARISVIRPVDVGH